MFHVISALFRCAGAIVSLLVFALAASCMSCSAQSADVVGAHVPKVAPPAMVLAGRQATVTQIPLSRAGNPEDVARAAVFLASEHDGFITGATLDINGGVYAA